MANKLQSSRSGSSWMSQYEQLLQSGSGWLERVEPGDRVFVGSACGEPDDLIETLAAAVSANRLPPITVYQMPRGGNRRLIDVAGDRLHLVGIHFHPELREVVERGYASFLPISIDQIARSMREGRLMFDVALVQVSPPDARGYMSLGVSVDFAAEAVRQSRLVVAQVNDFSPRTLGESFIHLSEVDSAVAVSHEIGLFDVEPADEVGRRIARHILNLVPAGATIEIGFGAVMTAILEGLNEGTDLGLHTGLIIEPMVDLIESGVVTNKYKGIDRGLSVANQCRGTRRLYDFLVNNPAVSMRPASYTHDPHVLGSLKNFRAINSAIEVDLLGQVNSEFIGGRRVSSSGGLTDFVKASHAIDGARSIIALRSTARKGESRIVARLGGGTTLTADLADMVVTEHGVADLRGARSDQRARALIRIADERFRDDLEREAWKQGVMNA